MRGPRLPYASTGAREIGLPVERRDERLRIARISPDELGRQLAARDKPLIVDLRSAVDVKLTPYALPGATRLAVEDLEQGRVEIPRDRDVVVYCS